MFGRWVEPLWKKKLAAPYVHLVFGARQTGKSTLLRKLLPGAAVWLDFSRPAERAEYLRHPDLLVQRYRALPKSRRPATVVVDEAQNVPAIFDAVERKEVYASTGTRLTVRVFAGREFKPEEVDRPDFAPQGYKRGVPMGGDLADAPAGKSPTLMIRAMRDPDGANLDRIQVIKGWLDASGKTQERIYDVAVSDGRKIGADGRCKTPVGNTVDIPNATWSNSIGSAHVVGYWKDPAFNAKERAFYYVRVIEIPTPRWTAYDAKFFNIKMPEGTKMQLQERAFTSPIWYTAAN